MIINILITPSPRTEVEIRSLFDAENLKQTITISQQDRASVSSSAMDPRRAPDGSLQDSQRSFLSEEPEEEDLSIRPELPPVVEEPEANSRLFDMTTGPANLPRYYIQRDAGTK